MVRLAELVSRLAEFDQGQSIYVLPPVGAVSAQTECVVVFEPRDGPVEPDPGLSVYLLEIGLAHEAILVAEQWRDRPLTAEEKVRAVIHYALNDAYLPADD